MKSPSRDWIEILENQDIEALWEKLFDIVSRHSAIRHLYPAYSLPHSRLSDIYADLTQDLFLKLYEKNRWQHYLHAGYTNGKVEHELYHIEIPNLVSRLIRDRYPESYRLVRRISTLLQTNPDFQCYSRSANSLSDTTVSRKMVLKVYGLSSWKPDKPLKEPQHLMGLIEGVAFRKRDTRRTGRGCISQVIIFNDELRQLLIDIFHAIDSPAEIRTVRSLALSKLPVENARFFSFDSEVTAGDNGDSEPLNIDFADERPTPEELLLEQEASLEVEALVGIVLARMKEEVRNKPRRYNKLIEIVWHCYFNPESPSQNKIARMMQISDSLVTHYRKIFDRIVQAIEITPPQWILFNYAFRNRLAGVMSGSLKEANNVKEIHTNNGKPSPASTHFISTKCATATAGSFVY